METSTICDNSIISTVQTTQNYEGVLHWVSNDAIFATLTSILVFSLGLLSSYIKRKITGNKNRKQIRHFVTHHIDQIIQSYSTSLIKAYKNFAHDTTVDTGIL